MIRRTGPRPCPQRSAWLAIACTGRREPCPPSSRRYFADMTRARPVQGVSGGLFHQPRQGPAVAGAEAGVGAVEVVADGTDGQGEQFGDLPVAETGRGEGDDLPLTGGEFA